MKNKRKWASILTIATSLILCIISTFGITLAFFGGNASANLSTITLKTGIEIGAAIESSVGSAKVVPGQPVKITATGTVSATTKGNPTEANAVDGVVRAKFNVGNELGTVTIAGNTTDYWKEGGDGYYYLVTAENGTTLRTVSKGTSVQIFGDLIVSKNFTNADSGKSVEASVIFEVIQADIYKADGTKETLTVTNATTSTSPLYSSFEAIEYVEPFTPYYHNEANVVTTKAFDDTYILLPIAIASDGADGLYIYYGFGLNRSVAAGEIIYWDADNLIGQRHERTCNWYGVDSFEIKPMEEYDNLTGIDIYYPAGGSNGSLYSLGIIHTPNPPADVDTIIANLEDLEMRIYGRL